MTEKQIKLLKDSNIDFMIENEELRKENKQLKENYDKEKYMVDKLTRQLADEYKNTENQRKLKDKYKQRIDKVIEYIEFNNENLYTFEPDYDYEEELVDNYEPSNYREDLLEILKGENNE